MVTFSSVKDSPVVREIEVRQCADGSKQPLIELSQVVVGQSEALQISQAQQSSRGNRCYGVIR